MNKQSIHYNLPMINENQQTNTYYQIELILIDY